MRRTSSRSQSRVRYIANRAKKAQERQRLQGLAQGRSASFNLGCGSLTNPIEERGNPEGACCVAQSPCTSLDLLSQLAPLRTPSPRQPQSPPESNTDWSFVSALWFPKLTATSGEQWGPARTLPGPCQDPFPAPQHFVWQHGRLHVSDVLCGGSDCRDSDCRAAVALLPVHRTNPARCQRALAGSRSRSDSSHLTLCPLTLLESNQSRAGQHPISHQWRGYS
ncbi:hypothetical protein NQZ68_029309 [Dissostichus eleginoides]|nr:hypothetical protein NQZ68_029309 [Dissostichus eleginoides]